MNKINDVIEITNQKERKKNDIQLIAAFKE
jgi:hypothetical protein